MAALPAENAAPPIRPLSTSLYCSSRGFGRGELGSVFDFGRENASEGEVNTEPIQRSGALYSRTGKLAPRGEERGIGSEFYSPILSTTKH
jgi:hypothetical protein